MPGAKPDIANRPPPGHSGDDMGVGEFLEERRLPDLRIGHGQRAIDEGGIEAGRDQQISFATSPRGRQACRIETGKRGSRVNPTMPGRRDPPLTSGGVSHK